MPKRYGREFRRAICERLVAGERGPTRAWTGAAADRAWPYALGGPTEIGNIVWLCPRHNQAKGVDVRLYPWEKGWPEWLDDQLQRVARLLR